MSAPKIDVKAEEQEYESHFELKDEKYLNRIHYKNMNFDQLEKRSLRMILNRLGRNHLPAVSKSIEVIKHMDAFGSGVSLPLYVIPSCIKQWNNLKALYLN